MISAIILAAGKSSRMGQNKMLMQWGEITVIEKVIQTIRAGGIEDIVVVVSSRFQGAGDEGVRVAINQSDHEMLSSIQVGLQNQNAEAEATLICLGDQPQIESSSVRAVCEAYQLRKSNLVAPSYQNRRGHPWLVAKALWDEILQMDETQTPRDFLNAHASEIEYVNVDSESILQDLDTPADYLKHKPRL